MAGTLHINHEQEVQKPTTLRVSEIYGPVCQGEGSVIGRPTVFVRFGGCDYRCSWCDSLYAVLPEHRDEWESMTPPEIAQACVDLMPTGYRSGHVTLSGGNPAIQRCGELVDLLHSLNFRVAIETQGTLAPKWMGRVDDLTISPKPPSSGNQTPFGDGTALDKIVALPRGPKDTISLKVVVFDDADYEYARNVRAAYPNIQFFVQAGTNVGEDSRDDLCDSLVDLQERILADPWMQDVAALPQLHAILKGHGRGI